MNNLQDNYFLCAKEYFEKEGNLLVPSDYKVKYNGVLIDLGSWVIANRIAYKKNMLADIRIDRLLSIGFCFFDSDLWMDIYHLLSNYYQENHHLQIPYIYVYSIDNIELKLGIWIVRQRNMYNQGKLSCEKKALLDKIGMVWDQKSRNEWDDMYKLALKFYEENHHLNIPTSYEVSTASETIKLGLWLCNQKKLYRRNELSLNRINLLNNLGIYWSEKEEKAKVFPILMEKYFNEFGNINVNENYTLTYQGRTYPFGRWVSLLKKAYHENTLDSEMVALLEKYNIVWNNIDYRWNKMYILAQNYYFENHHLVIPRDYTVKDGETTYRLGKWIATQRCHYKNGKLNISKIKKLENIGMKWQIYGEHFSWDEIYLKAKKYYETYGNLNIPSTYEDTEGYNLGYWIVAQKRNYFNNRLSVERINQLEKIGIVWNLREANWKNCFLKLKTYCEQYGFINLKSTLSAFEYQKILLWIREQQVAFHEGKLSDEKVMLLESIGFIWNYRDFKWNRIYELVKKYYELHGNIKISSAYYEILDGTKIYLANWLRMQRRFYNFNNLDQEKIALLEKIGITWSLSDLWNRNYELAKAYYQEFGNLRVKSEYYVNSQSGEFNLGKWINKQRTLYRNRQLSDYQIQMLEKIGMSWTCSRNDLRDICLEYGIDFDRYRKKICMNSRLSLLAKIYYLEENGIPFIDNKEKLHPIFAMSITNIEAKYGVIFEELVKKISTKGEEKCFSKSI